jgi:mannitol/fructose-specific phosphotransferase system IIA component (Ntr-type)
MEYGIALPHGSTDAVDDIIGALGISRRGLPFESLDGKPAHIVILLVLPKSKFQAHVRTLGGIAHLMSNASLRQALQNAPDSQTVIELIEREEERLPLH